MSPQRFWTAAAAAAGAVFLTRWPFRASLLFSWDSANYALAMEHIDIAAHRPHPPGYLGYVMTARGLETVLQDPNAALVMWNIIAAALIVLIVLRIAWDIASQQPRPMAFVVAAASMVVTSPLLWFYSDVAEIYPSELLGTLVIGFCAWRTVRGDRRAFYELAVAIPIAALFKLTAAVFMLPLAAFAWWRAPVRDRGRAGALLVGCSLVAAVFLAAFAPGLVDIIWNQFVTSTSSSSVVTADARDLLERLNHNARDTLTAGVSMLGVVNVFALIVWIIRDRRLPLGIDRRTALLWTGPWILLCVLIHIAKPGYILPVLPVTALILAGFYARLRPAIGSALIAIQAIVNVAQFAVLGPLPDSITGGRQAYRAKTFSQRMASDLQALTFATAGTIRETGEAASRVLTTVKRICPSMDPVVIATIDPIDARRLMWHLPAATVVHTAERSVIWIGRNGTFTDVAENSPPVTTACPVLWLSADAETPPFDVPSAARREPGVGFVVPARSVRFTPNAIVFEP